jgi:hypothetical protein
LNKAYATYDLFYIKSIISSIEETGVRHLYEADASALVDFYNVFSDYAMQSKGNQHFLEENHILLFLNYAYDNFFRDKKGQDKKGHEKIPGIKVSLIDTDLCGLILKT